MTDIWEVVAEVQHNILQILEMFKNIKKDVESLKSESAASQDTLHKLYACMNAAEPENSMELQ